MKLSELEAWCRERREKVGDVMVLVDPPPGTDLFRIKGSPDIERIDTKLGEEVVVVLVGIPW